MDEYSDDEDAGYLTIPVTRQDEFVLTELQLSDDEASPTRSSFGYHRCWLRECASWGVACFKFLVTSINTHARDFPDPCSCAHAGIGHARRTRPAGAAPGSPRCRRAVAAAQMGAAAAAGWAATSWAGDGAAHRHLAVVLYLEVRGVPHSHERHVDRPL